MTYTTDSAKRGLQSSRASTLHSTLPNCKGTYCARTGAGTSVAQRRFMATRGSWSRHSYGTCAPAARWPHLGTLLFCFETSPGSPAPGLQAVSPKQQATASPCPADTGPVSRARVIRSKFRGPQLEFNWKTACFQPDIWVFIFSTALPSNSICLAITPDSLHTY